MKIAFLTAGLILFVAAGQAQQYKTTVQSPKESKLVLKNFSGNLPVTGYNGSEIVISSDSGNFTPPEKAKGLKAVYPGGTDNTGLGLDIEKNGNQVVVTCLLPLGRDEEYKVRVPENMSVEIESGCERSNDVVIEGVKNEIDIKNCQNIDLKGVSGPLILSTISGDINITFGTIATDKPFSVNSVSGDIDITLPSKTATNLEMRTINGSFYSDFDFTDTHKDLKKVGGNELNFALNGGGFKFTIATVSGSIYLRKGN